MERTPMIKDFVALAWSMRVRLIAIWLVVVLVVLVRVLTMQGLYTSSCLLVPLSLEQVDEPAQSGFGVTSARRLLSGSASRDDYTLVGFLESRQLTDKVVEEMKLKRELFPERWDAEKEEWIQRAGGEPTIQQSRRMMGPRVDIAYDEYTTLLSLRVHWPSAIRAKEIADGYVEIGDRLLRDVAIAEGERRVAELRREMTQTTVSDIGAFLAEEMTRAISALTSIRARARYGFRIVDPPAVSDMRSWPPRTMFMILAGLVTGLVELGVVAGFYLRGVVQPPVDPGRRHS
ncbi:hypothetical protein K8S17_00525 [bacterium]|nr:hypothetical protein [bacterium]